MNRKHNPLAVFLYPNGSYIGIVPPWKSVMEILPLKVKYNGKGDAVLSLPQKRIIMKIEIEASEETVDIINKY